MEDLQSRITTAVHDNLQMPLKTLFSVSVLVTYFYIFLENEIAPVGLCDGVAGLQVADPRSPPKNCAPKGPPAGLFLTFGRDPSGQSWMSGHEGTART